MSKCKTDCLIINNERVINFYKKYKLDIETMNILVVDLFEKMVTDISGNMNNMMSSEILTNIKENSNNMELFRKEMSGLITSNIDLYKSEIASLKTYQTLLTSDIHNMRELIMRINNDISNNVTTKLFEIKQLYLDDLKSILSNNELVSNNKLIDLIEKENNIMIDKTLKTLNDIIPKSEINNSTKFEYLLNIFKEDIFKNIKDAKSEININDISSLIDNKYNNLLNNIQQSIVLHVGGSEERIYKSLNELRDLESSNISIQTNVNTNIIDYINKTTINSNRKGLQGENMLFDVIQSLFPSAEIINTSSKPKCGDILLKRNNKNAIIFENKVYSGPVNKDEVIKFRRDIEYNNLCGIMISQTSGISTKENFEIDILNGNILIYIHNCNYSHDIILVAINIIDHLSSSLSNINNDSKEKFYIKNDVLININEEYQRFYNKRNALKTYVTDITKKLLNELSDLELPNLKNILMSQFTIANDERFNCTICNKFVGINNKSLSKHIQSCFKKHNNNDNACNDSHENSDSNEINDTNEINEIDIAPIISDNNDDEQLMTLRVVENTINESENTNNKKGRVKKIKK